MIIFININISRTSFELTQFADIQMKRLKDEFISDSKKSFFRYFSEILEITGKTCFNKLNNNQNIKLFTFNFHFNINVYFMKHYFLKWFNKNYFLN